MGASDKAGTHIRVLDTRAPLHLIHRPMHMYPAHAQVCADDIMDAFEEAGTTVDTLQTPAHIVHAKVCSGAVVLV